MENVESSKKIAAREKKDKKESTFEFIKKEETALRDKLEELFPDDNRFKDLVKEVKKLTQIADAEHGEGIDKARALATILIIINKIMEETQRGKTGKQCLETIEERQRAEKEVLESEKHIRIRKAA